MKTTVLREASPLTDEYVATAEVNFENLAWVNVLIEFEKGNSKQCCIEVDFSPDGENWYVQSLYSGGDESYVLPVKILFLPYVDGRKSIKTSFKVKNEIGAISMRLRAKADIGYYDDKYSVEGTSLKLSVIQ